jgi:predicted NodU family carbamoyl transferase
LCIWLTLFFASIGLLASGKVVIGLNKYSHDTGVCIASVDSGEVKMIWAKERFSRRKHDGGDVADLLREALSRLDLSLDDVALVVSNNHHFRVLPYEREPAQLRWSAALGHIDPGAGSDFNLIPNAQHFELSHHLAHVWSAVAQAPFDEG